MRTFTVKPSQTIGLVFVLSISLMLVVSGNANRAGGEAGATAADIPAVVNDITKAAGNQDASVRQSPESAFSNGCSGVSFAQPGSPVGAGSLPFSVAVGDFNRDGLPDLVFADSGNNKVTILLGNGGGGFTQAAGSPVAAGPSPFCVRVGDFNLDGKLDLAVADDVGSGTVTILLGDGSGGFAPAMGSVHAGSFPHALTVGDFNQDGRPDLAVVSTGSGDVTILVGNGAGGFTQAAGSPIATGISPVSVATADFNLDGELDLAVANIGSVDVAILLGNGNAGFTAAAGSPITLPGPYFVAIGDFNEDGKPDLAVANDTSPGTATILLGNGSGGFTQPAGSPFQAGSNAIALAVGDFNLDARSDLALVDDNNPGTVTILLGNGSGGFSQPAGSPLGAGAFPISVAVADFNLDGKPDLATADFDSSSTTIQLNTCDAVPCPGIGFAQPAGSPVDTGTDPRVVGVGDFNLDGKSDLAVANLASSNLTILLGNGLGGFAPTPNSPIGGVNVPASVVVGDLNLDGKPDLAVANAGSNDVSILLGNGGNFLPSAGSPVRVGNVPTALAVGDFNLDGKPDLAVANDGTSNNVTILLGDGLGGFVQAAGSPIGVGNQPGSVSVADFNRDGKPDLAVTNFSSDTVTILLGNGSGGFTQPAGSPIAVGSEPGYGAAGDFNFDGKPDLAVTNFASNNVTILLGDGNGGFTQPGSPISAGTQPFSIAIADFNLDGKPDLVVTNDVQSGTVTILLGNGQGGFSQTAGSQFVVGSEPSFAAVGDFNRDGKPDLAVANLGSNNVTILANTCAASGCTLTCPANITASNTPNQCGAVVTYPAPTTTGTCGLVTCSPASGSFFPAGTTTITCKSNNGAGPEVCAFTVTVRDTQLPTIACPGNINVTGAAACPPSSTAAASFTVTASDNCAGATFVCRNQNNQVVTSGQQFPTGTTTVTCTATDASGNTAACSFAVTAFSFCLQDETNQGNVVLVNAQSGDYLFCCGGVPIASGKGTLNTRGCIGSIDHTKGDRRVHIGWDTTASNGSGAGNATVQKSGGAIVCQITDRKMTDNTCSCSSAPPP